MAATTLYINPAVFSSKKAGGFPVHTFVRDIIRDCGLECTPSCPDGDCVGDLPRSVKKVKSVTKTDLALTVKLMVGMIEELNQKIQGLNDRITELTTDKTPSEDTLAPDTD